MTGFTSAIDVVGHEIAHGILDSFCPLVYRDQAGALNESFSDIFGLCVKQWATKQSEWIFAKGIIPDGADLQSPGLRCFVNPGKAFFGKRNDRQIAHMKDYKALSPKVDNGGVHRYSGVPNH